MLQAPQPKDHVKTICIDQSLSNNALFEHKCIKNINKIYKHAGKCDNQQQFKDILEANIVSTTEGLTYKNLRSPMIPAPVKKPSDKNHCVFSLTY